MRLFTIKEVDLETLERELPDICSVVELSHAYNERKDLQEALQMIKKIVSDIRWNYGPAQQVEKIEP